MAKDHSLSNSQAAIQITQGCELLLLISTQNIKLFDGVQRLFLPSQPDDIWVGNHSLCKLPHRVLKGCREKQHLTLLTELPTFKQTIIRCGVFKSLHRVLKGTHLWIRMLWSRWPCVAIITSASSSTKRETLLGSMSLYFVHQSRTVPGVPMTMCSCSFTPRSTEHRTRSNTNYCT